MKPGFHIEGWRGCAVVLCVAACSAAPPAREANRARPVLAVSRDAGTVTDDPVVDEGSVHSAVCDPFDPKNPACRFDQRACLYGLADCKCPSPPDVENPACWGTMACPRVPDRRVRACLPEFPACPAVDHPDSDNPNCPASAVTGRVIRVEATETGDTLITVGLGTTHAVGMNWRATLLRGESDDALPGGEVTIIRVTARMTVGKVRVTPDILRTSSRVRFSR